MQIRPSRPALPRWVQAAHTDAVANYKALLTEVVRDCDVSWREMQPKLAKDPQVGGWAVGWGRGGGEPRGWAWTPPAGVPVVAARCDIGSSCGLLRCKPG